MLSGHRKLPTTVGLKLEPETHPKSQGCESAPDVSVTASLGLMPLQDKGLVSRSSCRNTLGRYGKVTGQVSNPCGGRQMASS